MNIISIINIINGIECLKASSFERNWNRYRESIFGFLGENPSREKIISLGSMLSNFFAYTGSDSTLKDNEMSRDQSDVSVSGNAWARLINWYLNINLLGTNCWAINNSDLLPTQVKQALYLSINGRKVRNSKEIVVLSYFGKDIPKISLPNDLSGVDVRATYEQSIHDFYSNLKLDELRVVLLSAKTNCSDMLAIPLFWNFCYKGNLLSDIFDIQVGNENHNPEKFFDKKVLYSIVTVPTGNEERIRDGSLPGKSALNKLSLLDGGFYWGRSANDHIKSFDNFYAILGEPAYNVGEMMSRDFEYIRYNRSIYYPMFFGQSNKSSSE